jgi:hypothetical protein
MNNQIVITSVGYVLSVSVFHSRKIAFIYMLMQNSAQNRVCIFRGSRAVTSF